MKTVKRLAHCLFRVCGYDLLRYTPDNFVSLRRAKILHSQNIDLVLDVGASEGTYPLHLRQCGYKKSIISFEPLSDSFAVLQRQSSRDTLWSCENMAIGDRDGMIEINVSGHKTSSSILPITELHVNAIPSSATVSTEKVKIARLDSLFDKMIKSDSKIYLKVDVQGYEKYVLEGAKKVLKQTRVIELELSLLPVYEGGVTFIEMFDYLKRNDFCMVSIEPVFSDPKTGEILQVDSIFIRQDRTLD